MMSKLARTTPHLSEKIWGGNFLSQTKNIDIGEVPIGETWEVSTLENCSSHLGELALSDLCELSYLIKFIDTKSNLSIQVHPDNEYASEHENSSGKTECWLILDSVPEAGIYLGFKDGVTKREFFNALASGINVDNFLNFYPVQKGDFFFVPAGAIHAIGAGVVLCEVQQSSGVTYRVWDWNRVDSKGNSRELHIEKAKETINFTQDFNDKLKNRMRKKLFEESQVLKLAKHNDFEIDLLNFKATKSIELRLEQRSSIIMLEGEIDFEEVKLKAYESGFVLEPGIFKADIKSVGASFLIVS